jgi:hypothetical protein
VDLDAAKALPEAVRAITAELVQTQHRVGRASVHQLMLHDEGVPVVRYFGRTRLTSLFLLSAESKSVIRLVSREKAVDRPLLRARVLLELAPASSLEQTGKPARRLSFSIVRPSFVLRDGAGERDGRALGSDGDDEMLVLAVGPGANGRLAVVFPGGRRPEPRFFYSAAPGDDYVLIERDPETKTWPLRPFSDLFVAVLAFVRAGFDANDDEPVPALSIGPPGTHLRTIVDTVTRSFVSLRETLSVAQKRPEPGLPVFDLEAFLVDVLLRTTKNGDIARDDDDNPFHLLLQFRWQVRPSSDQIRVAIGPPDFLVSGELLDAFGMLFRGDAFAEQIRQVLTDKGWAPQRIRGFLDDLIRALKARTCSVFRVNRKREVDTDIVVVPPGAEGHGWIFAADFELSKSGPHTPRVVRLDGDVRLLHEGDTGTRRVGELFVEYLSWLCAELHQWTKVLA